MVLSNPDTLKGSGLNGRSAADVDQREALEEMAIVKRLRRFCFDKNSHAYSSAPDMPLKNLNQENQATAFKPLQTKAQSIVNF
jgi:hypothetical protein